MMDEINEQHEQAKEIAETIAQPRTNNDYDEDELLAELQALEQEVRLIITSLLLLTFYCRNSTRKSSALRIPLNCPHDQSSEALPLSVSASSRVSVTALPAVSTSPVRQ